MSSNSQENQPNSNRRRPNNIRGPTSALTSFLRENNIRVPIQSRRARREQAAAEVAATRAEASSSAPTAAEASSSAPTPPTAAEASTSTEQLTERTHRLRLSSHSRLATASGSKKRKKEDSDDSSDSDDDVFMPEGASRPRSNPGVSVVFCGTCKRRFTRRAHQTVDTCLTCLSGDPKKPAAKRKKVITRINKNVQKTQRVPSLQDVCIGVIAENIEDVESFGFIGDDSLGKLSKIISKNRKMSSEISRLFMEPLTRQLHLYDCTEMDDTALLNIAQFCPRLQELHLSYCGKLTDGVVQGYGERLSQLTSAHFSGPYLVTKEAWMSYFKQVGARLESFELRYTSRFDLACVEALVESCPNLTNLKFGHITTLKSSWLDVIAKLNKLTSLELAWPDAEDAIQTQHVVDYLATAGRSLKHLSLKGGVHLDDKIFTGLSHCRSLETLHIEQASNLSAKGMVAFLKEWENPGLLELDIGRCIQFDDDVLTEIAQHSGASLTKLSIHSLDGVTIKGLEHLTGTAGCNALEEINCSFVRSIDDYVLAKMVKECSALCKVDVWGCPMLTDAVKCNEELVINGRELLDFVV